MYMKRHVVTPTAACHLCGLGSPGMAVARLVGRIEGLTQHAEMMIITVFGIYITVNLSACCCVQMEGPDVPGMGVAGTKMTLPILVQPYLYVFVRVPSS